MLVVRRGYPLSPTTGPAIRGTRAGPDHRRPRNERQGAAATGTPAGSRPARAGPARAPAADADAPPAADLGRARDDDTRRRGAAACRVPRDGSGTDTTQGRGAPACGVRAATGSAPVIATAVYLSGTSSLEVGGRYGFSIDGQRLILLGPHDPTAVALEFPIAGIVASIAQGNLLLTIPDHRLGTFLAFRGVAGTSLEKLVEAISEAADPEASARP